MKSLKRELAKDLALWLLWVCGVVFGVVMWVQVPCAIMAFLTVGAIDYDVRQLRKYDEHEQ